jgi:thiosulfate/3-mercaptopyruvate sulfurtransferase
MKTLLSISALFVSAVLLADAPILVTPKWVYDHRNDANVRIIQVNYLKFDYDNEHIPGSGYLWPGWLAPDGPQGAMNLPDLSKAKEVVEGLGISNSSHVILYFIRDEVSATARMFLTFENLGMIGKVSLIDGGLEAWKKEGFPVTKELPTIKKGSFQPTDLGLLVNKDYVSQNLKSPKVKLIDARPTRYYDGAPVGNPRNGHIAGAKNIVYTEMVDQSNVFKPVDQLEGYFNPVVPDKNTEIVTYCFIGQTASVIYMSARILGYKAKLYDGSMQEWSRIPELPMEETEKKDP